MSSLSKKVLMPQSMPMKWFIFGGILSLAIFSMKLKLKVTNGKTSKEITISKTYKKSNW